MIISGERSMTNAGLATRAGKAAAGFHRLGIGRGDVIALLLRNDFAFFEAASAAAIVGAFTVPINWHFGAEEIGYILTDCEARVLVVHADLLPPIASSVPPAVRVLVVPTPPEIAEVYGKASADNLQGEDWDNWLDANEPRSGRDVPVVSSSIVYTSGTTGRPKGVLREVDPEMAKSASAAVAALFDFRSDARTAITGPTYHSALNGYALGMAAAGADVWLMARFEAEALLKMIDQHRLTHLHLVPIMFVRMLRLPEETRRSYDVSSIRHVIHAAAPCPVVLKRRMIDWWGPVINEYFGSTETRMIAACNSQEWLAHPGTVGRILPNTEVAIIDESGCLAPNGEPGEIYAWNHAVEDFSYTNDSTKRAEVERNGLITAGDVGYLDDEGFLFLCDRRRDMINSGGVNIYPVEIESCLMEIDGVQDCAVFGIPDDEYGESVATIIQLQPGVSLSAEQVQQFVRERLARYKAPKLVKFMDQLPRDDSGKIVKRKLRDPYWQEVGRRI